MPEDRIVRKSRNKITPYKYNRTTGLSDDNSLLILDVRPEDSGTYQCLIGAMVGGRNKQSLVHLEVPGRLNTLHRPLCVSIDHYGHKDYYYVFIIIDKSPCIQPYLFLLLIT